MALIVEDGTGLATAESYISVADADAYFALVGASAAWAAASTTEKEQALRLGALYVDDYGRARGDRVEELQALNWPRINAERDGVVIDDESVPQAIARANAEAAAEELASPGALFPSVTTPGDVQSEAIKVGDIAIDTTYSGGASQRTHFSRIAALLRGYTLAGEVIRG